MLGLRERRGAEGRTDPLREDGGERRDREHEDGLLVGRLDEEVDEVNDLREGDEQEVPDATARRWVSALSV